MPGTTAPSDDARAAPRAITPARAGLILLGLLMGGFVVTQFLESGGPPVRWIYNLDEALARARQEKKRVFLYLHQPGCATTQQHDGGLFKKYFAQQRLAQMICCRLELAPGNELRRRFGFERDPLMIVLDADGRPTGEAQKGLVDQRRFETYIHPE